MLIDLRQGTTTTLKHLEKDLFSWSKRSIRKAANDLQNNINIWIGIQIKYINAKTQKEISIMTIKAKIEYIGDVQV